MRTGFIRAFSLAALAAAVFSQAAIAQTFEVPGRGIRAERWEAYGGLRALFSETVDFEGGSTLDSDDDMGFVFGFGYNFNEHLLVSGEFGWNTVSYDGVIRSADTPGVTDSLSGEFDTGSMGAGVTWNLLESRLTPYASAGIGYTWIDTNIATGPPQTGCWWDPWWGYICDTFVDTYDESSFNYNLGAGLRLDFKSGLFGRIGYEERWLDIDKASGTPSFGSLRLDFGGKF